MNFENKIDGINVSGVGITPMSVSFQAVIVVQQLKPL